MTAAVVCDAAIAARGEKKHLVLEGVRVERPAVAEDDGLPRAPVAEINLSSVFSGDFVHMRFFFLFLCLSVPWVNSNASRNNPWQWLVFMAGVGLQACAREIPSFCILEISVVRCNPSRAAAPFGPPTTQLVSASAWMTWSRSASFKVM